MPRSQMMVILALALLCGLAAGTFVYFMVADPPAPDPAPAAVQPIHVASPSPPSVVMLQTQSPTQAPTQAPVDTVSRTVSAAVATKMKPETQAQAAQAQTPRSSASLAQRVRHARRQCHAMAERICRCHPSTCAQQRQAHRDADNSVVEAARNLQSMPDALNQMLRQLEDSCRETDEAMRRSMPQCT